MPSLLIPQGTIVNGSVAREADAIAATDAGRALQCLRD